MKAGCSRQLHLPAGADVEECSSTSQQSLSGGSNQHWNQQNETVEQETTCFGSMSCSKGKHSTLLGQNVPINKQCPHNLVAYAPTHPLGDSVFTLTGPSNE
jgi:hypothetical protein